MVDKVAEAKPPYGVSELSAGIYAAYTYFTTVGIYAGNENNSPAVQCARSV